MKRIIVTILIVCWTIVGCANHGSDNDQDDDTNSTSTDIKDGTYSATVDYHNPETDYSTTYTLDVEVIDNQVTQIDFPNGGYLDADHISPADLDDDGNADVDGEDGKTYHVHIEDISEPE